MTATSHYVIVIYRYLPFFVILASTVITRAEAHLVKTKYSQYWNKTNEALAVHLRPIRRPYGSSMVCRKAVRFIYGLLEDCTVHLRPVGRPYSSTTARWKAVRFIIRFILQTVSRTYGQLRAPFRRQPRRHL